MFEFHLLKCVMQDMTETKYYAHFFLKNIQKLSTLKHYQDDKQTHDLLFNEKS